MICYAVVVTYNRPCVAKQCIEALLSQTRPPDYILVVENSERAELGAMCPWESVRVVRPTLGNIGGAGGFALGAEIAVQDGATHVLFVDDDCVLDRHAMQALLRHASERPNAVLGPVVTSDGNSLLCSINGPGKRIYTKQSQLPAKPFPIPGFAFHGLLVSKEMIVCCGLPRADFFISNDDVEFCQRLAAAGYPLLCCPDAEATHPAFAWKRFWFIRRRTLPTGSPARRYYALRNALITYRLHQRRDIGRTIAVALARELCLITLSDRKVARLRFFLAAVADGLRGDPRRTLPTTVPLGG